MPRHLWEIPAQLLDVGKIFIKSPLITETHSRVPCNSVNCWRLQPIETGHPKLVVHGAQAAVASRVRRSFRDSAKPGIARAPRPQWPFPSLLAPLTRER